MVSIETCTRIDGTHIECMDCPLLQSKDCGHWSYVQRTLESDFYTLKVFGKEGYEKLSKI